MQGDAGQIKHQYERFPYPSPPEPGKTYSELSNLAQVYQLDTGFQWSGQRILDVGTGTGVRLLELVKQFPENDFVAVDPSAASVAVARSEFSRAEIDRVTIHQGELSELPAEYRESFDVVFCMGVLHHLADPSVLLSQIAGFLAEDGIVFLYVYGEYGSTERMRRKRILANLFGPGRMNEKIEAAKQLEMTAFPYGWELRNSIDMDAMIVDAYLNAYEDLYTLEKIDRIIPADQYPNWIPFGFTLESSGLLVESRLSGMKRSLIPRTTAKKFLPTPMLQQQYESLGSRDRLRLLEDWYSPGGYTVILCRGALPASKMDVERLRVNAWQASI